MAQDPGSSQPKKSGFTNQKLRLSAPNPTAKGKWANLSFNIWQNNPRIVVATNDPDKMNKENSFGRLEAALDYPTMLSIVVLLKRHLNSKEPGKSKVANSNTPRGDQKAPPVHMTDVWVGRDEEGGIFISVVSKQDGWPVIKFLFGPPDDRFHKIYHGNGTEFTKQERSVLYAEAYIRLLEQGMVSEAIMNYNPPPPREFGGGNRSNWQGNKGGGYNNNRGGNNNYGGNKQDSYVKSDSDSGAGDDFDGGDDDIPFN